MASNDPQPHLGLTATLVEYLERGTRGAFRLSGSPEGRVLIDPGAQRLHLQFPAQGDPANVGRLAQVAFDSILDGSTLWFDLSIGFDGDLQDVYALICSIADRVQSGGETFSAAVLATLANLESILERRHVPTTEQQVGLVGELLVLRALVATSGFDAAIQSWVGPNGEEHDFRLNVTDLEVKTTLGERRIHWISSLNQLLPSPRQPLTLVSLQLTRAGNAEGWSLPELVDDLRALSQPCDMLDAKLRETVYADRLRGLLADRWSLRSRPAFFQVDQAFPALTKDLLGRYVQSADRILDVRYQVDVDSLPQSDQFAALIREFEQR